MPLVKQKAVRMELVQVHLHLLVEVRLREGGVVQLRFQW